MAKDSGIKSLADLSGKRVGGARATTNLKAVQQLADDGKFKPDAIVVVETHPQGMLALKSGKIDAYSTDRSLLEGLAHEGFRSGQVDDRGLRHRL